MSVDHRPVQIGVDDSDGAWEYHMPGDVCAACSDLAAGRWVPVNECPQAFAIFEAERARWEDPFAGFPGESE